VRSHSSLTLHHTPTPARQPNHQQSPPTFFGGRWGTVRSTSFLTSHHTPTPARQPNHQQSPPIFRRGKGRSETGTTHSSRRQSLALADFRISVPLRLRARCFPILSTSFALSTLSGTLLRSGARSAHFETSPQHSSVLRCPNGIGALHRMRV
jgi:hypothetical protein